MLAFPFSELLGWVFFFLFFNFFLFYYFLFFPFFIYFGGGVCVWRDGLIPHLAICKFNVTEQQEASQA